MPKPETLTLPIKVEVEDKPLAGLLEDRLELSHRLRQVEHELEALSADINFLLEITKTIRAELREMRRR